MNDSKTTATSESNFASPPGLNDGKLLQNAPLMVRVFTKMIKFFFAYSISPFPICL